VLIGFNKNDHHTEQLMQEFFKEAFQTEGHRYAE
jgi:hypothetical protein